MSFRNCKVFMDVIYEITLKKETAIKIKKRKCKGFFLSIME